MFYLLNMLMENIMAAKRVPMGRIMEESSFDRVQEIIYVIVLTFLNEKKCFVWNLCLPFMFTAFQIEMLWMLWYFC